VGRVGPEIVPGWDGDGAVQKLNRDGTGAGAVQNRTGVGPGRGGPEIAYETGRSRIDVIA